MYLKNLALRGFKTFADKTVIEFNPPGSITVIVGPNGCGKSNLVDAIRWALGEQNPKELRSSALEEVIFAGSSARKSLSLAEVSIDMDNTDNKIKTEFSELSIKRRTFRSGESEFFINKSNCRLKDIRDLFLDTGLGAGSYSIISQGQVDAVLSSKPEDRRAIFEEAAKINKYKFRKTAAERKLISTEQNMLRIADLKSEILNQMSVLEEQAIKAAEFTELKEKLKTLEVGLSKRQIKSINEKKNSVEEKISALRSQMELGLNFTQQIENEKNQKKELLRHLNDEIEGLRISISSAKLSFEENKSLILLENEKKKNLEERLDEARTQLSNFSNKLVALKDREKHLENELEKATSALASSEEKLKATDENVGRVKLEQENLELKISDLKLVILEKENALSQNRNALIELEGNIRFAKEESRHDEELIKKLENDKADLNKKIEELRSLSSTLDDRINVRAKDAGSSTHVSSETLKLYFKSAHGPASKLGNNDKGYDVDLEVLYGNEINVKGVKLNDSLILSDGSITGGSLKEKLSVVLQKEKEISTMIEQARTDQELEGKVIELKNTEEELSLARRSIEARKKELADISRQKEIVTESIAKIDKENMGLNDSLTGSSEKFKAQEKEKERLMSSFAELKANYASCSLKYEGLQNEIEKTRTDIQSVNDFISSHNKEEIEQRLLQANEQIRHLEGSLPKLTEEEKELNKKLGSSIQGKVRLEKDIDEIDKRLSGGTSEDRLIREALAKEEVAKAKLEGELTAICDKMFNDYNMSMDMILTSECEIPAATKAKEEAESFRRAIASLGLVNLIAKEEFEKTKERFNFIDTQLNDLTLARENLSNLIKELDEKARKDFIDTLRIVNENFSNIFATLFEGGEAKLVIPEENVLEGGIEIYARPGGKKWLNLSAMSGGERSLTAIALLFALLRTHPSPFCLLDEADAALDEANVRRFTKMLKEFSRSTQVVVITHNKSTMEIADTMYGITMEEPGVSKVVSVKLAKAA